MGSRGRDIGTSLSGSVTHFVGMLFAVVIRFCSLFRQFFFSVDRYPPSERSVYPVRTFSYNIIKNVPRGEVPAGGIDDMRIVVGVGVGSFQDSSPVDKCDL